MMSTSLPFHDNPSQKTTGISINTNTHSHSRNDMNIDMNDMNIDIAPRESFAASSFNSANNINNNINMNMDINMNMSVNSNGNNNNGNNNNNLSSSLNSKSHMTGPVFEATLSSYAMRVLKRKSPTESVIDSSVGPYVTSMLRSALQSPHGHGNGHSRNRNHGNIQIETLSEYTSLMELLEEHCNMKDDNAKSALRSIANAILTGTFDDDDYEYDYDYDSNITMTTTLRTKGRSRSRTLSAYSYGSSLGSGTTLGNLGNLGNLGGGFNSLTNNHNGFHNGGAGGRMGKYRSLSMGAENDYSGGRFRSLSMGAENDHNQIGGGRNHSIFFNDMLNQGINQTTGHGHGHGHGINHNHNHNQGDIHSQLSMNSLNTNEGCRGSTTTNMQISDNSMIEEEPSFLFEEDEIPGTAEKEQKQNSFIDFTSGMISPQSQTQMHSQTHSEEKMNNNSMSFTPLKPDKLIPMNLLGFMDDPLSPSMHKTTFSLSVSSTVPSTTNGDYNNVNTSNGNDRVHGSQKTKVELSSPTAVDEGPKDNTSRPISTEQQKTSSQSQSQSQPHLQPQSQSSQQHVTRGGNKKKKTKRKDLDLAASLFSRPRSRSVHDAVEKSPKLKPMAAPPASMIGLSGLNCASATAVMNNSIPALFKKQLDSAVQILMAMNYDICIEAAHEAALVSNADVNVAQHVIDGAVAAPPVCRHALNDGCYRSDCQFSHDVDGHTCSFWLKGRCGKGDSCRFMHGFSEKLMEGVDVDLISPSGRSKDTGATASSSQLSSSAPIAIKTANLVQHNMRASFALPSPAGGGLISPASYQGQEKSISIQSRSTVKDVSKETSTPPLSQSPVGIPLPKSTRERSQSLPTSTFSFASIASKGYSKKSSFGSAKSNTNKASGITNELNNQNNNSNSSNNNKKEGKTVRIPQNLWSPFYNRSSNAFHISDPLARYKEVSSSVQRDDVIDLHFQSMKTFPIVLSTILPEKLRDHEEVWIVTGSGHHVNNNSHQKNGGILENAVIGWLVSNDYGFMKGKDKNGYGGACLVRGRNR